MKILSVTPLRLPEVKVVRFARFADDRGYFTESFSRRDFGHHPDLGFLAGVDFVQTNESYSRPGTVRGLHFQWDPPQGKLVRTVHGHMVDIVVDIRKGSPNQGRGVMYDLRNDDDAAFAEWIWVPPGFAHGTWFPAASRIEYLCSAEYNPRTEGSIAPTSPDIDWSWCDRSLKARFDELTASPAVLMSSKDRGASDLRAWFADARADCFSMMC